MIEERRSLTRCVVFPTREHAAACEPGFEAEVVGLGHGTCETGKIRTLFYGLLLASGLLLAASRVVAQSQGPSQGRPGVPPKDEWTCPASHPIRGNFSPHTRERCIYYVPDAQIIDAYAKVGRCYATEEEAQRDGCRRAKR